jgi:hypothetical protein
MSSPDQAPPPVPDDDDYSPEPALDHRVQTDLIRYTELIAADDRAIAQAQARRIEHLIDLQDWAEHPQVASRLHGNPENIRLADRCAATMSADQARAAAYNRWDDHDIARRTIVSETACLTRVAERTIDRQLDEARLLYSAAPATFDALSRGEISYRHATDLLGHLLTLSMQDQADFEEAVLPHAKQLPAGRFNNKARRLRERLHPESIVTRTKNALAERRAYWEPAPDGMGWLHWYGTAHDTKAAFERINGLALKLKATRDPAPAGATGSVASDNAGGGTESGSGTGSTSGSTSGSGGGSGDGTVPSSGAAFGLGAPTAEAVTARALDQLRADITAALLLGGITPTGMGAGIRGTVMVTVPVLSLLGLDEEPATLEGYGPISPETAREIAGNASGFTRLLTHPETGVVLSLGKTQYKNTKAMKKWLRVRDETCRFPGCSRPAVRSDIDHTNAWANGGTTDCDNLAHLCEAHHRLKHLSQWQVVQKADGVLHWTSPGGRTYRTDPANPVGPPRPRPPVVAPKTRTRPADDSYLTPRHQPKRQPSPPVPENPPF